MTVYTPMTDQEPEVASAYQGVAWTAAEFEQFRCWLSMRDAHVRAEQIAKDIAIVEGERLYDNTGEGIDVAYNEALGDAETALGAQLDEGEKP